MWFEPLRQHATVVQDFFEFVNNISEIEKLHQEALVSLGVKKLFTNVPLDFTINLIH